MNDAYGHFISDIALPLIIKLLFLFMGWIWHSIWCRYDNIGYCSNSDAGDHNEDRDENVDYDSNSEVGYDSAGWISKSGNSEKGFSGGNSKENYWL